MVRGRAWERVQEIGAVSIAPFNKAPMIPLWGGTIEFTNGWISDEEDADRLIDEAEIIHGIRFVNLRYVLSYKSRLGRAKDLADIEALQAHTVCALDGG